MNTNMELNFDSKHAPSNDDLLELMHTRLDGLIRLAEANKMKQEAWILDKCQMDLIKLHEQY
jgi:hypothetical protein